MRNCVLAGMMVGLALPAAAQSLPYPVVDTGQDVCYDDRRAISCPSAGQAFYGQDAQTVRTPARYRDNGDGTINDLVTGLVWEKAFHRLNWSEAVSQAASARTGGHADWRVPTIKELYSLMDFRGTTGRARPEQSGAPADARPYLDASVFRFEYPGQGRYIDAQYVTSTTYAGLTMGHDRAFFGVNFADGRIKGYPQDGGPGRRTWYARFVRGNPAYGQNDFIDNGDGTVSDRATGLTWTRGDSGDAAFARWMAGTAKGDGRLDWREALAFCAGLDFAGHHDWRLPDAKELHSIVAYGRPADQPALNPVFQVSAIREADGSTNWPYAWTSTTHLDGRQPGDFAVYVAFGKAMGNLRQGGMGPMGGMMGGAPPGRGGGMGPPDGGRGGMGSNGGGARLLDVHGAGAQRSSPKSGDESRLPVGHGPQGDVLRIYNSARCVRG